MQQEQGVGQAPTPPAPAAPTPPAPAGRRRYRSLFWAVVLIGAGVVALLFNLDVIQAASLGMLTYVWPLLIIGFGADLLLSRRSLLAGGLVGVVTVALIVVLMLVGPALGWTGDTEFKTETFTTPVGGATSAKVTLETGGYSANVHALPASSEAGALTARPLLSATVAYRGTVEFQSSGDAEKTVSLRGEGQRWWWQFLGLTGAEAWDIGLDPGVPLALTVRSSSGTAELDLAALDLTAVDASMSSGDMNVALPAADGSAERYDATLQVSSGDLEVEAPAGAQIEMNVRMSSGDVSVGLGADSDVTLTFNGSSGQFTLDLVPGQAVRIEVRSVSSGDVDMPTGMVQIAEGDDEEGTWETQGFATASHKVRVVIEHMSSGNVTINRGD